MAIAEEVFTRYRERGVTGRPMFWRRDRARILADLEQFAAEDDGRPLATELGFDARRLPAARRTDGAASAGPSTGSTTPARARRK